MLSKNEIKFIRSLAQSKFRERYGCFVAEGSKVILEFVKEGCRVENIYATEDSPAFSSGVEVTAVTGPELKKLSQLVSPQDALAVLRIPDRLLPEASSLKGELVLACDNVRDPGNFGTMIRIADWFGIKHIVCSQGCVDAYNPKVVQASMGSLARVHVSKGDLIQWLTALQVRGMDMPVMVSSLSGKPLNELKLPGSGILVMGNEASGVDAGIAGLADLSLKIPSYGRAESLNVAVATGILCAELRRGSLSPRK